MASNYHLSLDELTSLKNSLLYLRKHSGFVESMGVKWCLDHEVDCLEMLLNAVENRNMMGSRGIFDTVYEDVCILVSYLMETIFVSVCLII